MSLSPNLTKKIPMGSVPNCQKEIADRYPIKWFKCKLKPPKKWKKSCCGHQLQTMTYFSKYHTFDPLLYLGCQMLRTHFFFTFSGKNRSNNKIFGKKNLRASTRSHDPFFDNPKIWPTFIYLYHQFFKSSCACSNSWPTKKTHGHQLGPMTHFFTNSKLDLLLYIGEKCLHTHLQSFLCVS